MFAIAFDLVVADTSQNHPKGVAQAYSDIALIPPSPLEAAPSTPRASRMLLLPTPLAPMKQLTLPSEIVSE